MTGYKPKFQLEYIGNSGLGVGVSQMGTGLSGGVSMLFSDILKRNQLFTSLRVNGRIYDFGGQVVYLNKGFRLNWGASLSHIPYRSSRIFYEQDTINDVGVTNLAMETLRTFEDQLSIFSHYPLSKKVRIEGGVSATRYGYMRTRINNYYYQGIRIDREEEQVEAPDPFYLYQARAAYVGDDSYFGLTSPLRGSRYRFQLERTLGRYSFFTGLMDYRRYYFINPFSLAFRTMHYGRYGKDAEIMYPLFLGNDYYVKGYADRSMQNNQCPDGNCLSLNNLTGSKMALINAEIRYPFSGPDRLALFKSNYFFSDLVGFIDGGLAWSGESDVALSWEPEADKQIPVFSTGVSLRVNLLGYIILEPYYAIPFQRPGISTGVFGFSLSAGGW